MPAAVEASPEVALVPVEQPGPVNLLSVIAQAALNPDVDVEKMRALLELKERIDANEAKKAFSLAMIEAQREMPRIARDADNPHTKSKYARLETIDKAIKPIYAAKGFALSFSSEPGSDPNLVTVVCKCMHEAGHSEIYRLQGAVDSAGAKGASNKTQVQGVGSSISYLRRYLTVLIFGLTIADEDVDGNHPRMAISHDQANKIYDLLMACDLEGDKSRQFLKFMGVDRVEEIPETDFQKAMAALQAKLRQGQRG
jgi:hypothetical protein